MKISPQKLGFSICLPVCLDDPEKVVRDLIQSFP